MNEACEVCGAPATTAPQRLRPPETYRGRRFWRVASDAHWLCDEHAHLFVREPWEEAAPGALLILDYGHHPDRPELLVPPLLDGKGGLLRADEPAVFLETFPGQGNSRGDAYIPPVEFPSPQPDAIAEGR